MPMFRVDIESQQESYMDHSDKEKAKGLGEEVKGKVKQAAGDITGDDQQKAEGKADEMKGKARKSAADAKDKVSDAVDDLKD